MLYIEKGPTQRLTGRLEVQRQTIVSSIANRDAIVETTAAFIAPVIRGWLWHLSTLANECKAFPWFW